MTQGPPPGVTVCFYGNEDIKIVSVSWWRGVPKNGDIGKTYQIKYMETEPFQWFETKYDDVFHKLNIKKIDDPNITYDNLHNYIIYDNNGNIKIERF